MPSLAQLQTWLEEAYAARHKLRTGKLTSLVRFGERTVQYNSANASELDAYINELIGLIADAQGSARRRRTYRVTQTGTGL